jgi:transposase
VRRQVPPLLERLPARAARCVADLLEHVRELETKIAAYEREIEGHARQSALAQRAQARPGVGAITASAIVASVGDATEFSSGRQIAAWLGLVPRQYSSGGKTRLGRITRRGDGYHRACVAIAAKNARVVWALLTQTRTAAQLERSTSSIKSEAFSNTARIIANTGQTGARGT